MQEECVQLFTTFRGNVYNSSQHAGRVCTTFRGIVYNSSQHSVGACTTHIGAVGGSNRSAVKLKQCSKRGLNDGREYGLLYSCEFVKKRDDTVLRVVWNGDLRLLHNGNKYASCRRWFFTINGQECSNPRTIDTQLHTHIKGSNMHRPAYVEGYCRGVAAGHVNVAWNVGDCVNGEGFEQSSYDVDDSMTGWVATVRIIVEEVGVEDADTVIV
ncbi:hypothetical protein LSAT2_015448 [Lamellibrachia satsuma]|nr:hypothetical protein LSAT2_015448 [Lamellibrachia satsuma]